MTVVLSREQVRRLDRWAIERYGFSGLVLMENAGRGVADVIERLGIHGPVVICCGKGNNAGDGFVIARHLDLRGYAVEVLLWAEPDQLSGDAAANFRILQKTDVPISVFGDHCDTGRLEAGLSEAGWIVDALLGTGARGEPRPPFDQVIAALNAAKAPKLAVDLPSGLNCDTGHAATHTVCAMHTCTFAAAKPGLLAPGAERFTGEVHVLDIGTPRKLLEEVTNAAED